MVTFEPWERERVERAIGVLSTLSPDGGPHAAPVQVWFEGDALRFETEPGSRKFRNIARDPRVAICVFGKPKWGVIVRGRAEVLEGGDAADGGQAQMLVRPDSKVSWRRKEG